MLDGKKCGKNKAERGQSVLRKMAIINRGSGSKGVGHADKWGKAFQAEGTAWTEALRWEHVG